MARRVTPGIAIRPVQRIQRGDGDLLPDPPGSQRDTVAVEEPLEIRVDGDTVAVTLRTPGADGYLALGFLFGEGVLRSPDDVSAVAPCWRPGQDGPSNIIDVRSGPGVSLDRGRVQGARRFIDDGAGDLLTRVPPVPPGLALDPERIATCVERLRPPFPMILDRTSGLHAAAAFGEGGALLAAHQDVGRHNAVDKVLGELLRRRWIGAAPSSAPPGERPAVLVVSGRATVDIIHRAAQAAIPIVAGASAASALAVDLAVAARITLVALVRRRSLNVYSCPERLTQPLPRT
ncbi:MAG TPA: formate dehydrogenase accessory sulfurtransferase FdhD [Candidatus Nanopelagicales bacterium]|nr:formate dehydrogenase accessory sulfurtransferase FdhD [Candidatus Nanopelagicales bacterium]